MIDPSTRWSEVKDVTDKLAEESMNTFDDVWLSRYPRPEYIGFEELVNNYRIKKNNSNPFNPQWNGIIERVHLTLNDALRTVEIDGREMDEKDPWGPFLSSAAYAIRSTFHTTLKATPGKLVFGRGMVLPLKIMADWGQLSNRAKRKWALTIEEKMPPG
jgi:hypothetical protein